MEEESLHARISRGLRSRRLQEGIPGRNTCPRQGSSHQGLNALAKAKRKAKDGSSEEGELNALDLDLTGFN